MGHYINETAVMLVTEAANLGDTKYRSDDIQALAWELAWVRALALEAGVGWERLGLAGQPQAQYILREAGL